MSGTTTSKWRVYLDQNILSDMARAEGGWRSSSIGQVLAKFPDAEVWLTPTHVIELLLFPDKGARTKLALVMLDASDARRMGGEYAYEVVEGFLAHVLTACPTALKGRKFLDHACETDKQLFIGALALLACGRDPSSKIVQDITHLKLENRWLRARAGTDPNKWLDAVREAARKLLLVPHDPVQELKEKSAADLACEIMEFEDAASRLPQEQRRVLEKEKQSIARAYGVADTLGAMKSVFWRLPADIIFTLDIPLLHEKWGDIERKLGCPKLPPPAEDGDVVWMLDELARSLWRGSSVVTASELAQEVVLRHYVERLNERGREREERRKKEGEALPTDSLTFDADHASFALRRTHVFVTRDRLLGETCAKLAREVGPKMQWTCAVVPDAAGLECALNNLRAGRPRASA